MSIRIVSALVGFVQNVECDDDGEPIASTLLDYRPDR